jgi:hypothetical protein
MRFSSVVTSAGATLLLAFSAGAFSQAPCRALDPNINERYEGECKDGLAHGKGKASGKRTYEGWFSAGRKQGAGVYTFEDGRRYEGGFDADRPRGKGQYLYPNGDRMEGEFLEGRLVGLGTMFRANGERFAVSVKDGKLVRVQEAQTSSPQPQTVQPSNVPPVSPSAATPSAAQVGAQPTAPIPSAAAVQWKPAIALGGEFYPALIVSTTAMKSKTQPPANVRGDPRGLVRVTMNNQTPGTRVLVTVTIDEIAESSSLETTLEKVGEYHLQPQVRWRYKTLTNMLQPMPANVTFSVSVNGQPPTSQTLVSRIRSVNEAPVGVRKGITGVSDMSWVFAAFVNEDHPWIDALLKEALRAGRVRQFTGYQRNSPQEVLAQVEAVWNALQRRGIRYSSITETSGESDKVFSQHVRFVSDSIKNTQANCIDGTVLMASILRKIDIEPIIVLVPGHAFLGFYLDKGKQQAAYLETTMLGTHLFPAAVQQGNAQAQKWGPQARLNPRVQFIKVADARRNGVMPIAR